MLKEHQQTNMAMFGRYVLTIDDDDTIPASPAPDTDKVYRRFLLS